jgi:hypothetical protein
MKILHVPSLACSDQEGGCGQAAGDAACRDESSKETARLGRGSLDASMSLTEGD